MYFEKRWLSGISNWHSSLRGRVAAAAALSIMSWDRIPQRLIISVTQKRLFEVWAHCMLARKLWNIVVNKLWYFVTCFTESVVIKKCLIVVSESWICTNSERVPRALSVMMAAVVWYYSSLLLYWAPGNCMYGSVSRHNLILSTSIIFKKIQLK